MQLFKNVSTHTLAMDTNLAIVILPDGSVTGIGRTGGQAGFAGIVVHRVSATNWKDPSSYVGDWEEFLFPNRTLVPDAGLEDPSLYLDPDNSTVIHAVFHNQIEKDDERLCGGHAYSEDRGTSWVFTGTSWGNRVEFLASEAAQLPSSSFVFSRRERPHLIFGDPSAPGKITHLSTGVQFGPEPYYSPGQDACFTFVQPVA